MNNATTAPRAAQRCRRLFALLALLLAAFSPARAQDAPADTLWIEAQDYAALNVKPSDKLKVQTTGWGSAAAVLSGGTWLQITADAADTAAQIPDGGIVLTYKFQTPKAAPYELWNRVGFERVRSPFDVRVDGGPWTTITPDQATTDVADIQTWNPVGWLQMGKPTLAAGPHTLDIRLQKTTDDKGKPAGLNYASDALVISAAPFRPNDGHKPGDTSWQTDADKAAASHVFSVPAPADAAQTSFSLKGDWQTARADEGILDDRTGPVKTLPNLNDLYWKSTPVPGDRNAAHPEWTYSHRYVLRTRVALPAGMAGRSLYLHFPSLSMIATLFVNGQACGTCRTPFADWDCDITRAAKPGQTNDIALVIKDAFYAVAPDPKHPDAPAAIAYTPIDVYGKYGTTPYEFPVWGHYETGILQEPTLITAGRAYTSDVFAIPSVKAKTLGLEITVTNPTAQPITVALSNEVRPLSGGPTEKTFAPQTVTVPANGAQTVKLSESWPNPKLWWPDDPNQYNVVTTLSLNGTPVDARTTKFGFREWAWDGPNFILNGVPWHGRADLDHYGKTDDASFAAWRKHGQTMQRVWSGPDELGWDGLTRDQILDRFDAQGMPVRRTGVLDGEAGGYDLREDVTVNGKNVTRARRALFDNWQAQLVAWAKGQRNHPSIFIWSMENEITFINSHNWGNLQYTDPEMKRAASLLAALDPTRPQMVDGGNALLDQSLPVYGGHYLQPPLSSLPEGAYDRAGFAHREDWPITQPKPILLGEDFFASGYETSQFATVGGEAAFVGKAEARPAIGLTARMLSEGYRWNDVNFHFWFGGETDLHYVAWQPVAALCRQWDWTFASGQRVPRTLGIFNDTHTAAPITLAWTLTVGGKKVAGESSVHKVAPGANEKFPVTLTMPRVATRQEGQWSLTLSQNGQPVFKDVKAVSVLPGGPLARRDPSATRLSLSRKGEGGAKRREGFSCALPALAVYDPAGTVSAYLKSQNTPFTPLKSLAALPASAKVLVIGKDALSPAESTSSKLAAYASGGHVVIVLEQKNPLRFQALPGEMSADANQGDIAFAEDLTHPILRGLKQKDFFTWGSDGVVYQNAYVKPTGGGKSLVQCENALQDTALVEMQAGKGLLLVSQLAVGGKLATNAVAQTLLGNMIAYGQSYKLTFEPVAVAAGDNTPLMKALDATGLQYAKESDPLAALAKPGRTVIVNASPATLHILANNLAKVKAFTQGGGWLVFNALTPEGLADYNKIVGVQHLIRPYGQEKVTFPATRNPLTAGLATSNVVLGSGKQIFNFSAGQYPDTDAFSYVVDFDDVAPFAKSTFWAYDKIVNNYTQADGFWPLIINFPALDKGGKPQTVPLTLPRPEKLTQLTWVSDLNYAGTTKINLTVGGKAYSFDTQPNGDPQTFTLDGAPAATDVVLQPVDWQHNPQKQSNGQDLIGIDNITLKAYRSPEFYAKVKPMLNIGALVEYPQGQGGIVLCNVKFKDSEANPENVVKKRTIISTILRNLHAPFTGGKTIIAGATNLTYTPLNIAKQANQFKTDQGWFGDKAYSFADLPGGRQTFAGVPYTVYSFATSPVPTVIMLGGNGVPGNLPDQVTGIPVNKKADALFFLQAARIDQRRSSDDVKNKKQFEMADYVVHYADGQTVKVPIYSEINVDNYHQETPAALPGAQIAWVKPFAGTKESAVAYSMQWNNPRPTVEIQSIDLVSGPDRRGVPVLLAVTAATAP